MDYEVEDKSALRQALLNLGVCPLCRQDLLPVAFADRVYGCKGESYPRHMAETWFVADASAFEQEREG